MPHNSALHAANAIHGYVLAHLKDQANLGAAQTAVAAISRVLSVTVADGSILAYIEVPGVHGPTPDRAAHQLLEAVEGKIQDVPTRATSYFDWTKHW